MTEFPPSSLLFFLSVSLPLTTNAPTYLAKDQNLLYKILVHFNKQFIQCDYKVICTDQGVQLIRKWSQERGGDSQHHRLITGKNTAQRNHHRDNGGREPHVHIKKGPKLYGKEMNDFFSRS